MLEIASSLRVWLNASQGFKEGVYITMVSLLPALSLLLNLEYSRSTNQAQKLQPSQHDLVIERGLP